MIRIYLHGVSEEANVSVQPNEIDANVVKLKQQNNRMLEFTNNSKNLPIIVQVIRISTIMVNGEMLF